MEFEDPALTVANLIDRIERLARRAHSVEGLNPAQWEALRFIARANRFSRTPAGMAAYLGSTRGTVSQTLIVLAQKGLIMRRTSERDRRSIHLDLTADGVAALQDDPLLGLAGDIAEVIGDGVEDVAEKLRRVLMAVIRRNDGRTFGICRTCRHFRTGADTAGGKPYYCALLLEPLSKADSLSICVEQEDA